MNLEKVFAAKPTFYIPVQDNRYLHLLNVSAGDAILCDTQSDRPARYVLGLWDGELHICTLIGGTYLFDEETKADAPSGAMRYGRVLYVVKRTFFQEVEAGK